MKREQKKAILRDLNKKMVFIAGPRQAGKTTLAKEIAKEFESFIYLTYDRMEDQNMILEEAWLDDIELIILDEIHKMPKWKNYLKGIYDTKKKHQKILVTGSARLEIFNEVGDSLAGRYFLHHLMPVSPAESFKAGKKFPISRFIKRGGFPEPLLADTDVDARRWRLQYIDSLLRTDVLDFDNIENLKAIQLLFELLRERVGSPISYLSLSRDIGIAPNTVKKYIQILEALYIVFRITPFSHNIARSLLKEPKAYFFDNGLVKGDEGIKFENLVATSLMKHLLYKKDYEGREYSLHFLQTKEKHEVDFAVVNDKKIELIIEAKNRNHSISKGLLYFHEKYQFPAIQVVKDLKKEKKVGNIRILKAETFLKGLDL